MADNKHETRNTKACSGSNNIHGQWHSAIDRLAHNFRPAHKAVAAAAF